MSSVQGFRSSQLLGGPVQVPPVHVSGVVHGLPSSQLLSYTQPRSGSQESVVHGSLSLQVFGVYTHPMFLSQVSVVQGSSSSHTIMG